MSPTILAIVFLVLLVAALAYGAWYVNKPKKPRNYEWPATPCRKCGEVRRVWSELLADEPSHRICDCVRRTRHWTDWEEEQRDDRE